MTRESEALLQVRGLHVRFPTAMGVVHAVQDASFDLAPGETLGVVGESGSGKSVLSRAVMGLFTDEQSTVIDGSVVYDGTSMLDLRAADRRGFWGREMAMVFQDPMTSLNPVKRIGVQIRESLERQMGLSRSAARERAEELLRLVGISESARRLRQYPHELSGGMRQRVMIAIAIACSPRLLFADEPTTALDVTIQAQILELLAEQRENLGMAMILVTHDLGVVRGHADRIIVMYAGSVVEEAPAASLFRFPRMPYTEALLDAVPPIDGPIHLELRAIPGRPPDLIRPPVGCRFSPRCAYAQDRCFTEQPPLVEVDGDPAHRYRCWYPIETEREPTETAVLLEGAV